MQVLTAPRVDGPHLITDVRVGIYGISPVYTFRRPAKSLRLGKCEHLHDRQTPMDMQQQCGQTKTFR